MATRNKLNYRWVPNGRGSQGTPYLGRPFTVVKDPKSELRSGLLADMWKQLGILKKDL
jgi:hypothetical protein